MQLQNRYILIVPKNEEAVCSYLWSVDYDIDYMKTDKGDTVLIADLPYVESKRLKYDISNLYNLSIIERAYIKYDNSGYIHEVFSGGEEESFKITYFPTNENTEFFIYKNYSFSINNFKKYWKPSEEKDFKEGMVVELLNNNNWITMKVENPQKEFNDIYKLFIKYDKIRVEY